MDLQQREDQAIASLRAGVAAAVMMVVACFCIAIVLVNQTGAAEASEAPASATTALDAQAR